MAGEIVVDWYELRTETKTVIGRVEITGADERLIVVGNGKSEGWANTLAEIVGAKFVPHRVEKSVHGRR